MRIKNSANRLLCKRKIQNNKMRITLTWPKPKRNIKAIELKTQPQIPVIKKQGAPSALGYYNKENEWK